MSSYELRGILALAKEARIGKHQVMPDMHRSV
jgi:hypothetical protein